LIEMVGIGNPDFLMSHILAATLAMAAVYALFGRKDGYLFLWWIKDAVEKRNEKKIRYCAALLFMLSALCVIYGVELLARGFSSIGWILYFAWVPIAIALYKWGKTDAGTRFFTEGDKFRFNDKRLRQCIILMTMCTIIWVAVGIVLENIIVSFIGVFVVNGSFVIWSYTSPGKKYLREKID